MWDRGIVIPVTTEYFPNISCIMFHKYTSFFPYVTEHDSCTPINHAKSAGSFSTICNAIQTYTGKTWNFRPWKLIPYLKCI